MKFVDPDGREFKNTYKVSANIYKGDVDAKKAEYDEHIASGSTIKKKDQTNEYKAQTEKLKSDYLAALGIYNDLMNKADEVDAYLYTLETNDPETYQQLNSLKDYEGNKINISLTLVDYETVMKKPEGMRKLAGYTLGLDRINSELNTNIERNKETGKPLNSITIVLQQISNPDEVYISDANGRNLKTFANEVGDIKYFFEKVVDEQSYNLWNETKSAFTKDGAPNKRYEEKGGAGYESDKYSIELLKKAKKYMQVNKDSISVFGAPTNYLYNKK